MRLDLPLDIDLRHADTGHRLDLLLDRRGDGSDDALGRKAEHDLNLDLIAFDFDALGELGRHQVAPQVRLDIGLDGGCRDHMRPVRPGMSGGTYNPLSEQDVLRIHTAALDALETIGLADAPASGVAYLTGAGAILGEDGRIRFPRALIEDTIAKANRSLTLHARNPAHDMELFGARVHYGTAGAAVHLVEASGREYRECGVQDLHDAARICEVLENLHFVQRPMVCRDITDNCEMDYNSIYACVSGTTKHIGTSFSEPHHVAYLRWKCST